jgi:site-specific recombinase XerD
MKKLIAYKRSVRPFILQNNSEEGSDYLFVNQSGQHVESSRVHVMMGRFLKRSQVKIKKGAHFKSTVVRKVFLKVKRSLYYRIPIFLP